MTLSSSKSTPADRQAVGAMSHQVSLLAICQAFWDIALDIAWAEDQRAPALVLTAAMPLQAGWQLRHEQLMRGLPFESILMDWGLRAAGHAKQGEALLHASPHQSYRRCLILRAYPPALTLSSWDIEIEGPAKRAALLSGI